jgi:hypothetical protein
MAPKFFLFLALVALCTSSPASALDMAELRVTCQEESKRRFKGPRRMKPEMYQLVLERRKAHVRTCMSEGLGPAERTASVRASADRLAATEE